MDSEDGEETDNWIISHTKVTKKGDGRRRGGGERCQIESAKKKKKGKWDFSPPSSSTIFLYLPFSFPFIREVGGGRDAFWMGGDGTAWDGEGKLPFFLCAWRRGKGEGGEMDAFMIRSTLRLRRRGRAGREAISPILPLPGLAQASLAYWPENQTQEE